MEKPERRLGHLEALRDVYKRRYEDMVQAISLEMASPIARIGPSVRLSARQAVRNGRAYADFALHDFLEIKGIVGYQNGNPWTPSAEAVSSQECSATAWRLRARSGFAAGEPCHEMAWSS